MKTGRKKITSLLKNKYSRFAIARDGFWFVDIPRTSSSSMRSELGLAYSMVHGKRNVPSKRFAIKTVADHRTAQEMSSFLGDDLWAKIFTFTIVRNPWDRIHSMYHLRKKWGKIPQEWNFRDYIRELASRGQKSKFFVSRPFRFGAADYILGANGQIMVDYIAKYENREQDLQVIASRLKIDHLGQRHIRSASPPNMHYSHSYDAESIEIIRNLYAKDIELFGYEFDVQD